MLGRTYDDQVCSIARTLEVLGERWTLLIVRDALLGLHRFDEFQESLGMARNVLTERLRRLVEAGVMERVPYQQRPERYEYQLTAIGRELGVPGDRPHALGRPAPRRPAGPPRVTRHKDCGGKIHAQLTCAKCGEAVPPGQDDVRPGPGLRRTQPTNYKMTCLRSTMDPLRSLSALCYQQDHRFRLTPTTSAVPSPFQACMTRACPASPSDMLRSNRTARGTSRNPGGQT